MIKSKDWGYETTVHNDQYCMKTLYIRDGECTSMHRHIKKHESLYCAQGIAWLNFMDRPTVVLKTHEAYVIPPGVYHSIVATKGPVVIVEASTFDNPHDSERFGDF